MKEIYIHIGLVKTGSTWLQESLFPKLELTLVRTNKDFLNMSKAKTGKFLISNEGLGGNQHQPVEFRYYFAHGIKKLHPNAKIIIGIRDANSWLRSIYLQNVKTGHIELSYLDWYNNILDLRLCDFNKYVKLLRLLFGDYNVFVYTFKDFKNSKHNIIENLCRFMNVDCPATIDDKKLNVGLYGYEKYFLLFNKIIYILRLSMITFFKFTKGLSKRVRGK